MTELRHADDGGYSFIPGVVQYSAGVSALPGYQIERVRFSSVVPLEDGFKCIAAHLEALGRPLTAFCACELRSPEPFTEDAFRSFNAAYADVLRAWGIMTGDNNPVARANVCPELDRPQVPGFHAFCYTVPTPQAPRTYVIAGSGEAPEGRGNYKDHIVARGDTSASGLREKATWVLGEMERRMMLLGGDWSSTTGVQLYCVHDVHPLMANEIVSRGAARHGLTWHFCRPPVHELEYEMDCRRVFVEHVLDPESATLSP